MYIPFVQALVEKFPSARILATPNAAAQLKEQSISNVATESYGGVELFQANHESMAPLSNQPPQNIGIHYLDLVSHPGDSHHFKSSKDILAVPITAPWGTTARAAAIISELRPEYVIPIHDWLWQKEIKEKFYERFTAYCKSIDVIFLPLEDGVQVEIN